MRRATQLVHAAALTVIFAGSVAAQDAARAVAGGGIAVPGWMGRIDANEAANGQKLENARLAIASSKTPGSLHVTTGPAVVYWNPANRATGNYTVKATFTEARYMALNTHPHPYGIVIAGNDMGTDQQRYLYCAAYGNGNFIMRGFGPQPFQLNGRRGEAHAAVAKAAAAGAPVSQEIAVSVTDDKVHCAINGTIVGTYNKADVVTDGKLASTDGVYGVRFGHNTEATFSGLTVTRP